jgi:hypothetical protein
LRDWPPFAIASAALEADVVTLVAVTLVAVVVSVAVAVELTETVAVTLVVAVVAEARKAVIVALNCSKSFGSLQRLHSTATCCCRRTLSCARWTSNVRSTSTEAMVVDWRTERWSVGTVEDWAMSIVRATE